MTSIKLEFFIKTKKPREIIDSLKIDDKITRPDVRIISNITKDKVHYIIEISKFNVGFIRNTFNDIIICIRPILDIIEELNEHKK
ncbi:MAG: hypothetical protein J7K23_05075 [Thermoproteales archaeon]|nr:hypothetical protein [Thermoproteales archaeon]